MGLKTFIWGTGIVITQTAGKITCMFNLEWFSKKQTVHCLFSLLSVLSTVEMVILHGQGWVARI